MDFHWYLKPHLLVLVARHMERGFATLGEVASKLATLWRS
jgi:hypothetical protein